MPWRLSWLPIPQKQEEKKKAYSEKPIVKFLFADLKTHKNPSNATKQ